MDILNQVMQMQQQGMSDADIVKQLRNEGANPAQINDAINQAKVKSAVGSQDDQYQQQAQNPNQQMQQSQPPQQTTQEIPQDQAQQPQMPQQEQYQQMQQQNYDDYAQSPNMQDYYSQASQYPEQQYYSQAGADTDTITEIAEQVVMEKFAEFNKKTGNLLTFKNETIDKINDLDERLKRIESSINNIQQAVVKKIGQFSDDVSSINNEINALNNTTSKLMNPLVDNARELERITGKKLTKKRGRPKSS